MRRFAFMLVALAPLCVSPSIAHAQAAKPGPRPAGPITPPKAPDRADDLFDQGAAAYHAGRLPEAEEKLSQAWALKKTHDIAGNLGVVESKLGKHPQAAEHLAWALQHFPPTESTQARRGYEQLLEKARAQSGVLRIRVNVDGADVSINGHQVQFADELFVEPGAVSLSARRDGYIATRQTFTIAKGEAKNVTLTLAPIVVEKRSIVPGVVLGSAAGAALVTGIALTVASKNNYADAKVVADAIAKAGHMCITGASDYDSRCSGLHSTASAADAMHNAGVGLFIGAAATAAGTLTYFLWPAPTQRTGSGNVRVTPQASATGGGLVISGAF